MDHLDKEIEVAVVIPVYNGARYLDRTIKSLQGQSYGFFRAYLIDDCSLDESGGKIKKYAESDHRIFYIQNEKNMGDVPRVINAARNLIQGDYFIYSSQDDFYSADWLESLVRKLKATQATAVVSRLVFFSEKSSDQKALSGIKGNVDSVITGREAFLYSLDWRITTNALWPMDFLRRYGIFDFAFKSDEYTWRYYFLKCETVAFAEGTFYYNQDNPQAITRARNRRWFTVPLNDLRTYQLAVEHGLGGETVDGIYYAAVFALIHFNGQTYLRDFRSEKPTISTSYAIFKDSRRPALKMGEVTLKKAIALFSIGNRGVFALVSLGKILQESIKNNLQALRKNRD